MKYQLLLAIALSAILSGDKLNIFSPICCQLTTQSIDTITPPAIPQELKNQWTPQLELEFQNRAAAIVRYHSNSDSYGNGYGENEKRSYSKAMFDFLAGNRAKAIAFLQAEDPEADKHQHTEGIDYYYCFTLKGQIRKYFLFGQFLDPTYIKRMYAGGKKWTEIDPNGRPHPIYKNGDGSGKDWDISKRGGWVDSRNTDNLRAMREVAVYLMAEETRNEETRLLYKQKIRRYVWALYNIGMGEWDSEVYHGHTFAPYLNLYDFAKDLEVKQWAKAALDWMAIAAALKYYRGGWGGPVKRDYGSGNIVYGEGAARTFWLYFGDNPLSNPNPDLDTLYAITSNYRPPRIAVAIARKQFSRQREILGTKPVYENWKLGKDRLPGYWETNFFGRSFQMGSVAGTFADNDVAPFKLMAYNSLRGVDYFVANTSEKWVKPGKNPGDEIGQYRNLLIWLRRDGDRDFFFQLPKNAISEITGGIWFFKLEKTWLAIYPINLERYIGVDIEQPKLAKLYEREQTYRAKIVKDGYAGFALQVGELATDGSYVRFQEDVLSKSKLDLSQLSRGKVKLQGNDGKVLDFIYNHNNLLPFVFRDGMNFNWLDNLDLYRDTSEGDSIISLGWKKGKLKVKINDLYLKLELN
jgi:hypothetical protein